jgi:hypothetical protein
MIHSQYLINIKSVNYAKSHIISPRKTLRPKLSPSCQSTENLLFAQIVWLALTFGGMKPCGNRDYEHISC